MKKIFDFHADDFALTEHASADIIQLILHGHADSISILPNMSCFDSAMEMLNEEILGRGFEVPVSVHLNFMEGRCLSSPEELPDLVDEKGYFTADWGGLVKASFNPLRKEAVRSELTREIEAQIDRVRSSLPAGTPLRLDSHQHTHMIPVVREALDAAVREKDYPVVFIRNAREPLQPFLAQTAYLRSYQPVNLVKNRVIASFAGKLEQDLKEKKLPRTSLCGLVLSGHMDEKRVRAVMPGLEHFLEGYGGTMEILFHPGRALPEEIGEEFTKKGFVDFHLSNGRKVEGKALIALTTGKEL
ncbi:MAG: ChbG/HpnK family deacetylase [Lachnospiraceae bacterium]|nr:ChbG/HpnK family deacetylase [Lachnospiraceae bacterium]MCI1727527.1 ChbG/HpnK family deacetylase [Lachnospiraceae bacterium]